MDDRDQDRLLGIPFDQYQRYRLVSDLINKFRSEGQIFKIIEVGASFEGNLLRFLPKDDIYFLDKEYPLEYSDRDNYIIADITKTDLRESYDFVISIDTYEHIVGESREKFVEDLILHSNIATIIAAPFDTPGVREHEAIANEVYKQAHGKEYRWLQEHIQNGLPSLQGTTGTIERSGLQYLVIPSGYLPRWFEMISLYLLTEGDPRLNKAMEELNRFYNRNLYRYDNQDPAYRHVIVVAKKGKIPDVSDICQVCSDPSDLDDAERSLKYIIDNIKHIYDISSRAPVDLIKEIESKDRAISDLKDELRAYEAQAQKFETQAQKFESQAQIFDKALRHSEEQVSALNEENRLQKDQIQRFESQVQAYEKEIKSSEGRILELNERLDAMLDRALYAERVISDMQQSILWQLTTKYHKGFVDRFMPFGTRRRRTYDLGLNAGRFFANGGLSNIIRDREDKKKIDAYRECTNIQDLHLPGCEEAGIEAIEKKVSIIIPTKNAGPSFRFTLEKIRGQRGVKEVEVLVVDSGSSDETLSLAQRFGTRVHRIKPEEFDHGKTRNLAFEMTTGDYILFMVQDAIPIGDLWLHDMAKALSSDEKVAAATCRQVPKSDADLFACFSMYSHQRAMELTNDRVASPREDLDSLPPMERRRLSGLEDVCTILRSDVFKKLKFSPGYAEDLDLGMRILKDNHKIAFLHSCGVVHSHNREPDYFLKRIYVDSNALHKIIPEARGPSEDSRDIKDVVGGIISLYATLNASLESMGDLQFENKAAIFEELKRSIRENSNIHKDEARLDYGTGPLDLLLQEMQEITWAREPKPDQILIENYFQLLGNFQGYLEIYGSLKDREMEFRSAIYKLFTIAAGTALSNHATCRQGSADERLKALDLLLSEGI